MAAFPYLVKIRMKKIGIIGCIDLEYVFSDRLKD